MEENNNDKLMGTINGLLNKEGITAEDKVGLLQHKIQLLESGTGGQGDDQGQGNDQGEELSSIDLIKNGLKALKGEDHE